MDVGVFFDLFFDFAGEIALDASAEDVVGGFFDEFDASFDDEEGNEDADVGFEIDLPNHVDDSRGEDGNGEDGVVSGVDATGDKGIRMDFFAGVFDEEAEGEFDEDGDDEDDDGDSVVSGGFGVNNFGDRFDEGTDAGVEDDGGDGE